MKRTENRYYLSITAKSDATIAINENVSNEEKNYLD